MMTKRFPPGLGTYGLRPTSEADWRHRGRWLTAATVVGILAIDLYKRSAGVLPSSPFSFMTPLVELTILGGIAMVCPEIDFFATADG